MKSISLLFAILMMSCSSYKNTSETTKEANAMNETSKALLAEGYLAGTIIASQEEGDCPFKIEVNGADGNYYLDPTNLETAFQKNGEKIWFKFTGLRMMNRCEDATPISLDAIQKRAE